jgi:hypothetical protein
VHHHDDDEVLSTEVITTRLSGAFVLFAVSPSIPHKQGESSDAVFVLAASGGVRGMSARRDRLLWGEMMDESGWL